MVPFTRKILIDWSGPQVFKEGMAIFNNHGVHQVEFEHPKVKGKLRRADHFVNCKFELLKDGSVDNQCPCRDNTERGIICAHVIALALELLKRKHDPEREEKIKEEVRRAVRLEHIDDTEYIQRQPQTAKGAIKASIQIWLQKNWRERIHTQSIPIICQASYSNQTKPLNEISTKLPLSFSKQDEAILYVLEDISEGPVKGQMEISISDFSNLLNLHSGKALYVEGERETLSVNTTKMSSLFKVDLNTETGELLLKIHTELPFMDNTRPPSYLLSGKNAWVFDANHFWPLKNQLPEPLHAIYQNPIIVNRSSVVRFFESELPLIQQHIPVESTIGFDLLTIEPLTPKIILQIQGSAASISATLYAHYDTHSCIAGTSKTEKPFAIPHASDLLHYYVRNPPSELEAIQTLNRFGFQGEQGDKLTPIVGSREVLNFSGSAIPYLRRLGWQVTFQGRIDSFIHSMDSAIPIVQVKDAPSTEWFEVGFKFEDQEGQSLSESEIQRALLKGDSYIQRNNRTILIDSDAIRTARDVFNDCSSGEGASSGTFRMNNIYSSYVNDSLEGLDGIDVEAESTWHRRVQKQGKIQSDVSVKILPPLEGLLRDYQKEGVQWLHYLETNHFCGILADEMGLGKTLETLAWIQLPRVHDEAKNKPTLIICPTSLVENWEEEAHRFVPDLTILLMVGSEREHKKNQISDADIVITSYALLRRDIDYYAKLMFSAIVLDEAQHIKNHSTQNALSAKRLKAINRLVLTGTPIENSVSDLWSIMDFLMPGYLGPYGLFKQHYETPISQNDESAASAQAKLKRKLRPFLLRRLKTEVAKDLPPKLEKVASCQMTKDQALVYKEMLNASQKKICEMVSHNGFNRSRMEILKTLLRLRQVCCHLDLLKQVDLNSKYPSGKMDLFFELLDEAIDAEHRVLVFSQFTSMLAILKGELDKRTIPYSYLDGSSKNRQTIVKTFNMDRSIPVFLISLKAGGVGLNLTGADMVIHFDPWWNPAVEQQATDRAYRIGQKKTVYSIKLITKDSVEEKVLAMQKKKKIMIDSTLTTNEELPQKLNWDDVQELLNL